MKITVEKVKGTKWRYLASREDGQVRQFCDGEPNDCQVVPNYKRWLKENCECAVPDCGFQGCRELPCHAHHEPPLGWSGRKRPVYWLTSVSLCPRHHILRTHERLPKKINRQLLRDTKKKYPQEFLEFLFKR